MVLLPTLLLLVPIVAPLCLHLLQAHRTNFTLYSPLITQMESLGFKQVTEVGWTLELSNARGKQLNAQQIAKIIKK